VLSTEALEVLSNLQSTFKIISPLESREVSFQKKRKLPKAMLLQKEAEKK
jgi:hypothetical protein